MTIRLGSSELFVLVFGGRSLLHWFLGWLVSVDMHPWGAGVWDSCKWLWPPLDCAALLLEGFKLWSRMNMVVPCSIPLKLKVCAPNSSHRREINHPSCVSSFHHNTMFILTVSILFFFLSQACYWVSKLQILVIPMTQSRKRRWSKRDRRFMWANYSWKHP